MFNIVLLSCVTVKSDYIILKVNNLLKSDENMGRSFPYWKKEKRIRSLRLCYVMYVMYVRPHALEETDHLCVTRI